MEFTVETERRLQAIDVTDRIESIIPTDSTGLCTVFVRHTTVGVCVNEGEPRLLRDVEAFLADAVADDEWRHDELDDNADAHLRALLVGSDVTIPVEDGRLVLGTWQSVLLVECDGPRTRHVSVTIVSD